jgi:hypothetical protein
MPDDLARRLDSLQQALEKLPTDLSIKLDKIDKQLGTMDRRLSELDKGVQEAAQAQQGSQHRLEALDKQIAAYISEDRAARDKQYALTALVGARADHDRQFGHHQVVRRAATGILRAMIAGTVRPAVLLEAAEQLMVGACDYWLPAALVAVAAWAGNGPESARRAVLEAVSLDPGRSALFFSVVLARFGRQDAAASWITEYVKAQDGNALTGEFTAVLDAVAQGALGRQAREHLLDACRGWRDHRERSGAREAKQVASWTEFIAGQRRSLAGTFDSLGMVSLDWGAKLDRLEAAAAFGHTEQWLKDQLGSTIEDGEGLQDVADGLLRELIAAPDQAERALLEEATRWRDTVERGGRPSMPAGSEPGDPVPNDLRTLSTAIVTGAYRGQLSPHAVRFCLALSVASVERALTDLSQQVRNTYPASIEVDIEGWHHAMEHSDDPETLVHEFQDWAHEAMTEEKAQSARGWLGVGRSAARLQHIENTWQERQQNGQDKVYVAATQAIFFYQKWQHGLAAAERCIGLLRAQPPAVWSDAQAPGTAAGPASLAIELPDWDPRPPDPG